MVTYNLDNLISTKIFNFNRFIADLDLQAFVNNPRTLPCECRNSKFKDSHHRHIVTGDLRIIENNNLRKILSKGPKFRPGKVIDFNECKVSIITGITECLNKWCVKHAIPISTFSGWLTNVKTRIDLKILQISSNFQHHRINPGINNENVLKSLKDLHEKYVITHIDKATGNIAIICKRHYASVLVQELNYQNKKTTLNPTYQKINEPISTIVKESISELKNIFRIDNISLENQCLPKMYWIPKMHKTPSKSRFIVAAPKCSIKPLSKAITSVFKLFYKQIEAYNKKSRFFTGVNTFWVVQSNKQITDVIKNLNKKSFAKSINTFDFSTLYTKIPHDKLKSVLNSIVDFCFKGGVHEFIVVNEYEARWSKYHVGFDMFFDKNLFKLAISYLLDNCHFTVGEEVFRQIIGIPMGSDPTPFFANFFLYFYERDWILNLKKTDLRMARKLSNVFRFIDDLNILNDCGEFERFIPEIYPKELVLNKENVSSTEASFLDLYIQITEKKFSYKLYDKRDDFSFSIVRMPHSLSNIPTSMFYSCVGAEILRIARATSDSDSFLISCRAILKHMKNQGAVQDKLVKVTHKIFTRHMANFEHVALNKHSFSINIFN